MVPVMSSTVSICYFEKESWLALIVNLMGVVLGWCV
jgi:hypothetical protein